MRSAARRSSTAPVVRRLQAQALAALGFSRDEIAKYRDHPPTVAFHFGLVGHGYQMDIFVGGNYLGSTCRDFSNDHKVDDVKSALITAVAKAVNDWRMKL